MGASLTIGIVAGEPSGDTLGASLVAALKEKVPAAEFVGIGGPKMQAVGVQSLFPMEKLAVHGYAEALRHYPEIAGIRRSLKRYFLRHRPDVFIGVDAPDFNLGLEAALKRRGIATVHYVSPSIWAWRGGRISKIQRSVDHMLVLFPFEAPLYQRAGIPVTYVGHPLADLLPLAPDRSAVRAQMQLPSDATVVAILPGSRAAELRDLAEPFILTAKRVAQRIAQVRFLVPLATRQTWELFEAALYRAGCQDLPLKLMFGHAIEAMIAADGVLVASGTATLEAALLKRPMVIAYKISPFSWQIMRHMGYLPYVGLPNILAGRFVVPEFLQDDVTPENLTQALLNQIADKAVTARLERKFDALHRELRRDAARTSAQTVLAMLKRVP